MNITREDWYENKDCGEMLDWVNPINPEAYFFCIPKPFITDRKFRLFSCACWWQVLPLIKYDQRKRKRVQAGERYAEVLLNYRQTLTTLTHSLTNNNAMGMYCICASSAHMGAYQCMSRCSEMDGSTIYNATHNKRIYTDNKYANLLRDIINPWVGSIERPLITPTIRILAEEAYNFKVWENNDSLCPSRLGILADALEDVNADTELIAHLRDTAKPCYKGCWALDVVLGKE